MRMNKHNTIALIVKDGNFAIYKTIAPLMGGNYSVVSLKDKTAQSSLCLDAAFEIFRQLTLEATLRANNMID